jgi:hypothetical protein
MTLDPTIWGPHYWFFLHTITLCYPLRPNTVTKKRYYDFIHNFYLLLPIESISTHFSKLIIEYPVTPYLDSRDSFIRWMHFIHNKINQKLEKPQVSLDQFYKGYYENYKPRNVQLAEYYKIQGKIVYFLLLLAVIVAIYYLYHL